MVHVIESALLGRMGLGEELSDALLSAPLEVVAGIAWAAPASESLAFDGGVAKGARCRGGCVGACPLGAGPVRLEWRAFRRSPLAACAQVPGYGPDVMTAALGRAPAGAAFIFENLASF